MAGADSGRVLWDMVDGPMPRGVLGLGIGDLVLGPDEWTLYLGGYSTSFRNRLYSATAPSSSDPATARWTIRSDRWGRAVPLLDDPPRSAWDGGGVHTPSFVPSAGEQPARIYYAGRAGRRHVGVGSEYAIGVLELHDGQWRRRDAPILTGTSGRPSVLEPRVIRYGGQYRMWFLSSPHEVARGEQPDYEIRTTTSPDGVTAWTTPQVFATTHEGYFDVALAPHADRWVLVLARGTNLHGTTPYPAQGLWAMTAQEPSPAREAWGEPVRLLDTEAPGTPEWMGHGVCDPAAIVNPDSTVTVFVSGTRRYRSWLSLAGQQLRRRKRLPVPAPFFLSAAVLRLPLSGFGNDDPS